MPSLDNRAGRVVLDVGPGRVRVDEVTTLNPHYVRMIKDIDTSHIGNRTYRVVSYEWKLVTDRRLFPLCEAPCALELPEGPHDLHLQGIDDHRWASLHVEVTSAPQTYRVGLGYTLTDSDGLTRLILGLLFLTPGTGVLTAAAADWAAVGGEPSAADRDRVHGDSVGLTIAGGVLLVAGIVGLVLTRPTEQPSIVRVDPR